MEFNIDEFMLALKRAMPKARVMLRVISDQDRADGIAELKRINAMQKHITPLGSGTLYKKKVEL